MTPAERKARSRALVLGELDGQLQRAERLAADWRMCMTAGRPGATDDDIRAGFDELAFIIGLARLALPRS